MSVDEIDGLLNRRSGVFGLAGVSDFRDLQSLVDGGDDDAVLALDVYCHRVRKYVGAYLAVLGGARRASPSPPASVRTPPRCGRAVWPAWRVSASFSTTKRNAAASRAPRVISARRLTRPP